MPRQHTTPYLIYDNQSHRLSPLDNVLAEGQLQDFLFAHPQTLPIAEIEPIFAPLIPLCRKMGTDAGPVDLVYAKGQGLLTLVECKLQRYGILLSKFSESLSNGEDTMFQRSTVKVSSRYQIALPSAARQRLNIAAGDQLLVDVQDGLILLLPEPVDYVDKLAGLHQEVWADIDTDAYLNEERNAWSGSRATDQTPGKRN